MVRVRIKATNITFEFQLKHSNTTEVLLHTIISKQTIEKKENKTYIAYDMSI